ncbi:MAG: glucose-1-phosphate thymidylyltransferase [Candidatus Omnitrophota bacterium]|nr:MAG: glucose-1-phosphate thymidylyltransferase [Candidatus Omnitrophota bacterium]
MKALMLAGGRGTRLKPITHTVTKQLLPVANRPILHYAIDQIRQAGISDIGIIISPETGSSVQESVGDGLKWDARITYIVQPEPLGLAHAVKMAQGFLGESPFIMHLGDTLIQTDLTPLIEEFQNHTPDALIMLQEVSDVAVLRLTGVVQVDETGKVISLEEKPQQPKSNLALIGIYFFSPAIHESISRIKPSQRGELEITNAIQDLVDRDKKVLGHRLRGWWLDAGKKDDLLEANRAVLDQFLKQDIQGQVDAKSSILGRVEIRKGAVIEDSAIRGPVSIAEDCVVKNSFIGPFTSIGKRTVVEDSSVEHSVILEDCHINSIERLADSLIGNRVNLAKREQRFKGIQLFTGDDARIEL